MPEKYVELRTQLGAKSQVTEDKVSGSRTPPVPVRLDFDAIIRDMLLILCSWDEAVACAERLDRPYTAASLRRRDEVALPAAVTTLVAHFDTLLGLPRQPMARIRSLRAAADLPAGTAGFVHEDAAYAEVNLELDGADAGLEIIHLHWRARSALRMTSPPPEKLDGIPCRKCEMLSLERAAPPRSPEGAEYWSECAQCGHLMSRDEYVQWVKLYAAWVNEQQTLPLLEAS
jgi:hypothetical protein